MPDPNPDKFWEIFAFCLCQIPTFWAKIECMPVPNPDKIALAAEDFGNVIPTKSFKIVAYIRETIPTAAARAQKPKRTHGGKRPGSGRKKKDSTLGNQPQNPGNSERRNPPRPAQTSSVRAAPGPIPPHPAAPFFGPYNIHQATPLGNPLSTSAHTGRPAF
ncbi:hypothetical protein B0H11DRAFT_1911841 [Mycena galericulata]|nr:hypothetical protein B0H11DRAFT_1911841 [Mycena galericulata]